MIKTLDFLGYFYYRVNSEGNIYRFAFWQSGLNEQQCLEIQQKYKTNNYTQKELGQLFNTTQSTISNILKRNKDKFWIKMKPGLDCQGYYYIGLWKNKNRKRYQLHRIICEAFHGPCPEGMEGCHNDGNPLNNHYLNLRWDTHKNNLADKIKHGTSNHGERCGTSKLKNNDIYMIKYLYKFCTQKEIGKIYNLSQTSIGDVINNRTWKV